MDGIGARHLARHVIAGVEETQRVRTTLDIDDDVLAVAEELAAVQGRTPGEVLSELARQGLRVCAETVRHGVPLLRPSADASPVTSEVVDRLLDEEVR